jgi:hypothetical protein
MKQMVEGDVTRHGDTLFVFDMINFLLYCGLI